MDKKQITIVVALIKDEQGRILLAKRHEPTVPEIHGRWEFVGGGIEFGESPEEAIVREVKEESGLEVEVVRLFPKIINDYQEFSDGSKLQVIIITYECKIVGGQLQTGLNDEIAELKYFTLDEVKSLDAFKNTKELAELLS